MQYLTYMIFMLILGCSSGTYHNVSKTGERVKTSNSENTSRSGDGEADSEKKGSDDDEESDISDDDEETDDNSASDSEDQENDDNDSPSDENETDDEDKNERDNENEDDDDTVPPPEEKEDTKLQVEFVDTYSSYACGDDEGNGELTVTVPASAEKGDLLGLFVHRTDAPLYEDADAIANGGLPLVDGIVDNSWKKEAACYMKVNGEPCTEEWRHQDLIQMFLWKVYNEETESYTIQMPAHRKSRHITPQWATLVVLRNADPNSPVYGTATRSPDGTRKSLFPKVKVPERGYLLLSQSFDDAVAANIFQAPDNTRSLAYITGGEDEYGCDNDETGFLFGSQIVTASEGQEYITNGNGVSTDKDIMMSISIRPKQ